MIDARTQSRLKDPAYVRQLLADCHLTHVEICARSGVPVSTLTDWMRAGFPKFPAQLAIETVCQQANNRRCK